MRQSKLVNPNTRKRGRARKVKTPRTKAEGRRRAITMLRDLETVNWNRSAPKKSESIFDKSMREAITWPRDARLGFADVCADWLATGTLGFSYSLDGYEGS